MKKIYLFIIFALLSNIVLAQKLKSGFENIENKKYSDAAKVFNKALEKGDETIAAMYGMGLLCNIPEYSGYNTLKAFRFVRNVNDRILKASPSIKKVCKESYKFEYEDVHKKMIEIASAELKKIENDTSKQNFEWYISTFEGADSQIDLAKNYLAELVWKDVENSNNFRQYKYFYDNFPNSIHAQDALKKYEIEWKKICEDFYSEGEIEEMRKFATQYPDYPFYTDENREKFKNAEFAEKLLLNLHYNPENEQYYNQYIQQNAPLPLAFVAVQRMISNYLEFGRWDDASNILLSYKDKFPNQSKDIDKIVNILKAKTTKAPSKSFSDKINSKNNEYAPVLTADGMTMYFCGYNRPDNIGGEDIFITKRQIDGTWSTPKIMSEFNTPFGNEAPLAISPDGNTLLIYKDSDIYYSEKTYRGWTQMKKMASLNTPGAWDADASFSPDGNAIFFISDRKGNIGRHHPHEESFHGALSGNLDIYVCVKDENGNWGEPINLGPQINTPFAERSPILASDMKTLYFSSDGHYGLGRLDVFMATRLSDTSFTQWSEPINLGKEINTPENDYNYAIMPDGENVLFTKFSNTESDICVSPLPIDRRPNVVASVFGRVTDSLKHILPASIKWEDLETGKILGNLKCDPTNGSYFITLPSGKNYGYYVEYEGYYPVSGNLNTESLKTGKNIEHNIIMYSIQDILNGKVSIKLSNIFFSVDKADLKSESYAELNRLSAFLSANSGVKLEISGHTDSNGSAEHNKTLSQRRAEAVKEYLISQGCDSDKIDAVGYGAEKPVSSNSTEQGRAQNRRVEFKIIK
ncbi:MAG: OmpA family protein [Bacteroidales bacterium]|nr:OmpA family protein [Bacteroidales bacterium]